MCQKSYKSFAPIIWMHIFDFIRPYNISLKIWKILATIIEAIKWEKIEKWSKNRIFYCKIGFSAWKSDFFWGGILDAHP